MLLCVFYFIHYTSIHMKIINKELLDATTAKARQNPRLRMNYNFHDRLDDPVNRLINAVEPNTYIRPHRHKNPDKDESFLLLRGKVATFIFNEEGEIIEKVILSPKDGIYGADIQAGVWHAVLVLEPGSIIYEAKPGPFTPLSPENLAPWSPAAEDKEAVKLFLEKLQQAL